MRENGVDVVFVRRIIDVEIFEIDLRVVKGRNQYHPVQTHKSVVLFGGKKESELGLVLCEMPDFDQGVLVAKSVWGDGEYQLLLLEALGERDEALPRGFGEIIRPFYCLNR